MATIETDRQCITSLLELVNAVAAKQSGVDVNPARNEPGLRLAFVLIGRTETMNHGGVSRYLAYLRRAMRDGIQRFYLIARGWRQTKMAKVVAARATENGSLVLIEDFETAISSSNAESVPEVVIYMEVPLPDAPPRARRSSRDTASARRRNRLRKGPRYALRTT